MRNLQTIKISYSPEWFKTGYYVYVITIKYEKQTYYYIGQTGDRKHISARSPFYRLMGHFNTYNTKRSNSDSQLMNGILNLIGHVEGVSPRYTIEQSILEGKLIIDTKFELVKPFSPNDNKEEHTEKRRFVEEVEQWLIEQLSERYSKILLNNLSKIGKKKIISPEAIEVAETILKSHQLA